MDLILKGGTIVTASDTYAADIGIEGERIKQIGHDLGPSGREIDVSGKLLFPGGVDVHTHAEVEMMGEKSADNFYSSTVSAACGGVTTIVDYAFPAPGQTLMQALDTWNARAKHQTVIDYGLHPTLFMPTDDTIAEMADIVAEGYTSFKVFMTGFAEFDQHAASYMKAMNEAGRQGALVNIHAEDQCCISFMTERLTKQGRNHVHGFPESRPRIAEGIAARRAVSMARLADAPIYLVHLSCKEGLDAVNDARAQGLTVYGETRPIYLHLSKDCFNTDIDPERFVGWPPLRDADQMDVLWQGLDSNVLQTVATDHVGWSMAQKKRYETVDELVPGMSALETLLPMLYSEGVRKNRISANRFVEISATNPAKLFGLYPQKGTIAVGSDADIMVLDPDLEKTIQQTDMHSNQDWEIFEGFKVTGWPVMTLSRGEVIVDNGKVLAKAGRGKLIKRKKFTQL